MCGPWWHIRYRSLLAILRKKVGELKEESRNLYRFVYMNPYIQIHLYNFVYVNSHNLRINITQIISSSIVHKGQFHGHDTALALATGITTATATATKLAAATVTFTVNATTTAPANATATATATHYSYHHRKNHVSSQTQH
jgi:hypothetical protein